MQTRSETTTIPPERTATEALTTTDSKRPASGQGGPSSVREKRRMPAATAPLDRPETAETSATPAPTGARGAPPAAVLAVIAAGAIACLALWWQNTPPVAGLGEWLTNARRITGLLAGYGVAILLALMARIPALERGIGADKLARWHAIGGRYTVSLVTAHALLIIWGYAVTARTDVVSQTETLWTNYPNALMATVAGLLLIGVGVVSARAARRRMRYETWYFLHLYTYLAVALAFSHQFANGAEFMHNRPARVAWSAFYLAVAAAAVWYRFAVPIRQTMRHRLRVAAAYPERPGVVSVVVTGKHLDELRAQSGQFFRWRFLTRELWWASNPYSLSAAPRADRLRITVKNFGGHSAALRRLRPGTRVVAEGPYGALTAARRRQHKVLLIAGGIGITPLRALYQTIPAGRNDVRLIYRASRDADVVFREELEGLARQRGLQLTVVTGRRTQLGYDPLSAQALTANIPDLRERDVYVCGPNGMATSVIAALRAAGVPRRQIHHESFEF
jgi:predicted ferric reductase